VPTLIEAERLEGTDDGSGAIEAAPGGVAIAVNTGVVVTDDAFDDEVDAVLGDVIVDKDGVNNDNGRGVADGDMNPIDAFVVDAGGDKNPGFDVALFGVVTVLICTGVITDVAVADEVADEVGVPTMVPLVLPLALVGDGSGRNDGDEFAKLFRNASPKECSPIEC
jgi:hypothetical protein